MPGQVPISNIISRSKVVRVSSRCASSNLPSSRSLGSSAASSASNERYGLLDRAAAHHIVARRVDRRALEGRVELARQRVEA